MSQIDRLIANYQRFVQLPWPLNLAGAQRVWFAVYPPAEERRLRARVGGFEVATLAAKHGWRLVDITDAPARWLAGHDYREGYFADPEALGTIEEELKKQVVEHLREACQAEGVDQHTVVAVMGTGSLFGFTHVSSIIAELEGIIRGRLLVFFPGEYERNLYRFMDAREGFNYMAMPITCSERLPL
ncbi:MAG: DUF1788 domain-containing protein [Chloroflexi bacterium]|nr:DUF1788 domain-containing protein [Chloroflexota bacterium]